jgi:hypothetical protein
VNGRPPAREPTLRLRPLEDGSSTALIVRSAPRFRPSTKPPFKDAALLVARVRRWRRHRCGDPDDSPQSRGADCRKQLLLLLWRQTGSAALGNASTDLSERLKSKIMIGKCQRTGQVAIVDGAKSACLTGIESAVLGIPTVQTESLGHDDSSRSFQARTVLASDKAARRWCISSGAF